MSPLPPPSRLPRALLALAFALALAPAASARAPSARPPPSPPSRGAVETGAWRNVFAEAGYAQSAIDAKVKAAFSQLYLTGDAATQRIAFEVPGNMTYVTDAKNRDVRTEGLSYGMMVAVQLGNATLFDRIWRWTLTHHYHSAPSDPLHGWSAWHATVEGVPIDQGPAPDGETFFITALLFAGARWGDSGAYNYTAWANEILGLVAGKPDPQQLFDPASRIVRFDPGTTFSDPSYMTPAFYASWARAAAVTPDLLNASAQAARDVLFAATSRTTGLAPNMCDFAGGPGGWTHEYQDDAWRVVRNWAIDYAWWAADARQVGMSNALLAFFAACGSPCQCDYFNPASGACTRPQYSPGAAAMNAVGALASNSSLAWDAVDALWAAPIPEGDAHDTDRYYSGSLYLEALLHLSGNYRAWF